MTCCGWRLIPHQSEESLPSILELTMNVGADKSEPLTAIHTDLGAIFVSLELSRSSWLITSLSPGGGEKMSKHSVRGGDFAGLMERFAQLQEKARLRRVKAFGSSLYRRPVSMGFGFTGRSRTKASKATLSTRPQLQRRAGAGGQRPTRSMVKRWFERCSPTSAANLGSVQWSRRPLPARKTAATSAASAKR